MRQVGLLIVDVVHFEKRGGAFAGRGRKHRRVGKDVALAIHVIARGADRFGTDAQDAGLARRANPEMAMVEKKIDAVFLELDGIGLSFRNFLENLDFGNAHFKAAGRALFGPNFAGDDDAGFLRQTFQRFKGFGIFLERADALNDTGAVAKDGEHQFAGFTQVIKPAADGDFLAVVLAGLFDGNNSHSSIFLRLARSSLMPVKAGAL